MWVVQATKRLKGVIATKIIFFFLLASLANVALGGGRLGVAGHTSLTDYTSGDGHF